MKSIVLRGVGLLGLILGLGLGANALSPSPVPVFSRDGPGRWAPRAPRLSILELTRELGHGLLLLDVRAASSTSPAGALRIPADSFRTRYVDDRLAGPLRAAAKIAVLCEGGACAAADRVAELLRSLGHSSVFVVQGGWPAYEAAGLPVEIP